MGPYNTTYKREYTAYPGEPGQADRPNTTSRAFQASYSLKGQVGTTTYGNEFYNKPQKKTQNIRTGSASGNRRNNPHPLESFMVWRLPQKVLKEQPYSEWGEELTDEMMDQVCRGQIMSTYQQDYLGIPQGYQVKSAYDGKEDWRSRVPYTLDTFTRKTYQNPDQQPELKGNTKRYGCNKHKHNAAIGAVPTVSSRMPQMNIKTRTTYEREYNEPSGMKPKEVRDISKQLNSDAIEKYYEAANDPKEREKLTRMMRSMNIKVPRPPSSASIRSTMKFEPSAKTAGLMA